MEELPKSIAFTDPMSAVFDLNDDLMKRIDRLWYVVTYAHVAGMVLTLISPLVFLVGVLNGWPTTNLAGLVLVVLASLVAWRFARQEVRFLFEYRLRSSAVNRARTWDPHPNVPEGPSPLDRLIKYPVTQDDRVAYLYGRHTKPFEKDVNIAGKSGRTHRFEAYLDGRLLTWRRTAGPIRIFVRTTPVARIEDLKAMKKAVEDVLESGYYGGAVRAFLLQIQAGEISEDVTLYANLNPLDYAREVGGKELEWSSPIELIAENPGGAYNIASFYFG